MTATDVTIRRDLKALSCLAESSAESTGPVGYLIGSAYGLLSAVQLGYRPSRKRGGRYADELRRVAGRIASDMGALESDPTCRAWLARVHFNSALHRLAAAADRLGIHPNGRHAEPSVIAEIREEVNDLKHDRAKRRPNQGNKGLVERRNVSLRKAVSALRLLTRHCRKQRILGAVQQ